MTAGQVRIVAPSDTALLRELSEMDAGLFPGNVWGLDAYAKSAENDYDRLLAFVIGDACESRKDGMTGASEALHAAGELSETKAERTAGENAHAAGFALLRCFDDAELIRIAASPEHRREGIGRRLLDALIDEAKKCGAGSIFLEVRRSNAAAIKLYEGAGFEHTGVRKDYYHAPKEDALIMRYTC